MTLLVLAFCAVLAYWLLNIRIAPKQEIQNTIEVSKSYAPEGKAKVQVDKPLFKLELPAGWKERGAELAVIPAATYTFQSPDKPAQLFALYIDAIPATMAVNGAVVVAPQGDGIISDTVSGNCTTYTDASKADPRTKIAQARWQNINFLCDMANFNRGVVGTQSTEGINQVTVKGPTTGEHKLFIRYTDNTVSPNYNTLYEIIRSLHFK